MEKGLQRIARTSCVIETVVRAIVNVAVVAWEAGHKLAARCYDRLVVVAVKLGVDYRSSCDRSLATVRAKSGPVDSDASLIDVLH